MLTYQAKIEYPDEMNLKFLLVEEGAYRHGRYEMQLPNAKYQVSKFLR